MNCGLELVVQSSLVLFGDGILHRTIVGVGLSIIGGAITTMGAGAPQFACVILFFRLNGTFIFLTSGLAIFFSFFMLIPLLMAMGPEGQQGELCFWRSAHAQEATPGKKGGGAVRV